MQQGRSENTSELESFRRILHYMRSARLRWGLLVAAIVCALGASFAEGASLALLIPTIKGVISRDFSFLAASSKLSGLLRLLPAWFGASPLRLALLLAGLTFSAVLLKTVFAFSSSLLVSWQVRRFAHALRTMIFQRYLRFGKLYFDRHSTGYLHQVLTTYVNSLAQELSAFKDAVNASVTLIIYVVMMCAISAQLTLLVLLAFPLLYTVHLVLIRKIQQSSRAYAEAYNLLGKSIANFLSCVPLIKSYNSETEQLARFQKTSEYVALLECSIDKKRAAVTPSGEIIMLSFLLLLVFGIAFMTHADPKADVAPYLVFLLILKRAAYMCTSLNFARASLAAVHGPLREIDQVFDDSGKHFVVPGTQIFTGLREAVEFAQVQFTYPSGAPALSGVTFSIGKGSVTALVGGSGSGKTTIVNLLMRFYDPQSGRIVIDGIDLRDLDYRSWSDKVALVPQEPYILNATLRENLLFGMRRSVTEEELRGVLSGARLDDLFARLPEGLETEVGDRGVNLSGGEKQRLSIARALLRQPELLVLDEYTSALDSHTEGLVQAALSEAIKGKTTLLVAHRLTTIQHADRIVVVENGRVVETGAFQELLSCRGAFFHYWRKQLGQNGDPAPFPAA